MGCPANDAAGEPDGNQLPTLEQARAWYPGQDPVHGFDHVERVLALVQKLGAELGADLEILQAAALLHDAAGAAPLSKGRAAHEHSSAEFAQAVLEQEGWPPARIEPALHCIRAHRYRGAEEPISLEAQVLFDADKLDVIGAFGVARTIGYAVQAGTPIFAEPSVRFLDTGELEPGELHSAYHEYLFKLRRVRDRLRTEPARRLAAEREQLLRAFFEQLAAEARGEG
ncbi:MAG: HD domain-containing protein [Anaerolineales bacterium]